MKINDFVNDYPRLKFGGISARQMFKEVYGVYIPLHLLKIVNRGIKNRAFNLAIYDRNSAYKAQNLYKIITEYLKTKMRCKPKAHTSFLFIYIERCPTD